MANDGEELTIDGATGEVFQGRIPTIQAELGGNFGNFLVGRTAPESSLFVQMPIRLKTPRPQFASVPKALDFVALSTCSLHPTASTSCVA